MTAPDLAELLKLADEWDKLADENDNDGIKSGEAEWSYRASELRSCAASLRVLASGWPPAGERPVSGLAAPAITTVVGGEPVPAAPPPPPSAGDVLLEETGRLAADLERACAQREGLAGQCDKLREQLDATRLALQETSRESSRRGEQLRLVREDRDSTRKRMLTLADELEDEAPEGDASWVARTKRAAAARIRKALDV